MVFNDPAGQGEGCLMLIDHTLEKIRVLDHSLRVLCDDPDVRDAILKQIAPITKNKLRKAAWWGLIQAYAGNSEAHRAKALP